MKYCKKCFRNVREDVDICPYCGAPGLEEYGSHNSGEAFTCSQPKTVERELENEIKAMIPEPKEDAYTIEDNKPFSIFDDEQETDAYGNLKNKGTSCNEPAIDAYGSKAHNDDSCDNAPDVPPYNQNKVRINNAQLDPNNPQYKMRIEYLNMLKKIDGISPQRIEELMKRYDESHSRNVNDDTFTSAMKKVTVMVDKKSTAYTSTIIMVVMGIVFGFFQPVFGLIIINLARKNLSGVDESARKNITKVINVFTIIYGVLIAIFVAFGAFGVLFSGGLLDV